MRVFWIPKNIYWMCFLNSDGLDKFTSSHQLTFYSIIDQWAFKHFKGISELPAVFKQDCHEWIVIIRKTQLSFEWSNEDQSLKIGFLLDWYWNIPTTTIGGIFYLCTDQMGLFLYTHNDHCMNYGEWCFDLRTAINSPKEAEF